jgi:hypothetical protein
MVQLVTYRFIIYGAQFYASFVDIQTHFYMKNLFQKWVSCKIYSHETKLIKPR